MKSLENESIVEEYFVNNLKQWVSRKRVRYPFLIIGILLLVIGSNLYLQFCQNNLSWDLAFKFAFSWHEEKFFLGCLVLLIFLLFLMSLAGSLLFGTIFYSVTIGLLGFADYQKMLYREEPIYPDDLKMVTEFGLLREMIGTGPFVLAVILALVAISVFVWGIVRSIKLSKGKQTVRLLALMVAISLLTYISNFNQSDNLLRKAYDRTALWIPYSQKMNYYNTGFMGGFLYNLKVEPMEQPANYSKESIQAITTKYQQLSDAANASRTDEQPNIIFIMNESFSDTLRMKGVSVTGDPLSAYRTIADTTYSGQMLSQNYGGGTANIEFEALTGFSMELMNPQMTTPYTMLVPKMEELPSIVSLLKGRGYDTTAIHPYNTSMYKRQDVYDILGFDQFLYEDTMTHTDTIGDNPYISDAAAYAEILDELQKDNPQFVHLVTMQNHMPYSDKYDESAYTVTADGNTKAISNYLQDIAYSSEALKDFLKQLQELDSRTLVVFWGDHLPSIYSDAIKEANDEATLHETEFLLWDSANQLTKKEEQDVLTSPFYFAADLLEQAEQPTIPFYQLLLAVQEELPAFEKGLYYVDGSWQKEASLSASQQAVYEEYQLIQYDIVAGAQYSLASDFFKE